MAECSYARCIQQRRHIKRELQKWTKDMVYIVGLERVAEELMGRRKWKLYQEVLARSQLNVTEPSLSQNERLDQNNRLDLSQHQHHQQQQQQQYEKTAFYNTNQKLQLQQQTALVENHSKESEVVTIKSEIGEDLEERGGCATTEGGSIGERFIEDTLGNSNSSTTKIQDNRETVGGSSYPVDWNPTEKCYFCVDGKLLTVNERGELVAESGPAQSEAELANRTSLDSDSDSSDSSPDIEVQNPSATNASKSLASLPVPPNMTSLESMAAQIAASLRGLSTFCPNLWYPLAVPPATITTSEANTAAISPTVKESLSPSEATGEQPLDLSAKPSPNSSTSSGGDPKQALFRAKPRMSAITGRRTYTEEELHSALQDIMSGKLGTRRAAVQYGIPRSTLRNKVYKISTEQKRGGVPGYNQSVLDPRIDPDDDDKDLSGDDEKDDKLLAAALGASSADDLSRFASTLHKMNKVNDTSQCMDVKPPSSLPLEAQVKLQQATTPQPQTPPITPNAWFDSQVLFQSLLLSGGLGGIPGLQHQQELLKEHLKNATGLSHESLLNNKQIMSDPMLLMPLLQLHQQQQQQQQQHSHHSQKSSVQHQHQQHQHQQQQQQQQQQHHYQNRSRKSETPETASSIDMNEMSDDPSVILKIPSYKPVAGTSSSGKNGDGLNSPVPQTTPPIMTRSPQHVNSLPLPGISPPLAPVPGGSESQSPPIASGKTTLSLREVIAKSICHTFNQQANNDPNIQNQIKSSKSPMVEPSMDQMNRATISVIKTLGSTRFASTPNLLGNNSSGSTSHSQNASMNQVIGGGGGPGSGGAGVLGGIGGAGGKGTRPKRGKYRNYDRDSLVEAVKAVQRGEMSVHRAGSYYGVPHSTLEYKVKERHLMRPRKREPKPQPLDERTGCSSSSSNNNNNNNNSNTTNSKNSNIPGISAVSSLDKQTKSQGVVQKSAMKNPPFPSSTSPNGMKVPIFDPAMAAQFQFTSQLFWPHSSAFGGIPIDFARAAAAGNPNAAAVAAAAAAATAFPSNSESFIASQMMQRFHEDSNRLNATNNMNQTTATTPTTTPTTPTAVTPTPNQTTTNCNKSSSLSSLSLSLSNSGNTPPVKSARELAESLYDGPNSNGLFLDGIIRQTLDRKASDVPHATLLDQLVKNTRTPTINMNDDPSITSTCLQSAITGKTKRSASPLPFSVMDIKRERSSPSTSSCDPGDRVTPIERDISRESVESLLKMRDGLTLKVDNTQQQQQQQQQQHFQQLHNSHLHVQHHSQMSGTSLRQLSIEELNGSTMSSIHDKLGQIKSEPEDI